MAKKGRGTRTHGHGRRKRGGGRRGGRGYAGSQDSKWVLTIKGGKRKLNIGSRKGKIGHIGKYGFTRGDLKSHHNAVNLRWIEEHFSDGDTVDLMEHGFDKLLGLGKLTKKVKIVVPFWSKSAEEKVKSAGGSVETGHPEEKTEEEQ